MIKALKDLDKSKIIFKTKNTSLNILRAFFVEETDLKKLNINQGVVFLGADNKKHLCAVSSIVTPDFITPQIHKPLDPYAYIVKEATCNNMFTIKSISNINKKSATANSIINIKQLEFINDEIKNHDFLLLEDKSLSNKSLGDTVLMFCVVKLSNAECITIDKGTNNDWMQEDSKFTVDKLNKIFYYTTTNKWTHKTNLYSCSLPSKYSVLKKMESKFNASYVEPSCIKLTKTLKIIS